MLRRKLIPLLIAGLATVLALVALPAYGERPSVGHQQTWPSRTPTSSAPPTDTSVPPPPTSPPPGSTATPGNGGGDTPTPVSTVEGNASPTTAVTSVLQTPEGGYLATAEPCSSTPTVQALGLVNVRQGPGIDYDPISQLTYLEVRPIVGRAAFAPWWLIELPDESNGWVADQAVTVQGYIGNVPLVKPPALDGGTPTPGPAWNPTPFPACTPAPTPTRTLTPTPGRSPTVDQSQVSAPTNTPLPSPTDTVLPPSATVTSPELVATTESPTATVVPGDTVRPLPSATAAPLEIETDDGGTSSMVFVAGAGLIVLAAGTFIWRQRSGGEATNDS